MVSQEFPSGAHRSSVEMSLQVHPTSNLLEGVLFEGAIFVAV